MAGKPGPALPRFEIQQVFTKIAFGLETPENSCTRNTIGNPLEVIPAIYAQVIPAIYAHVSCIFVHTRVEKAAPHRNPPNHNTHPDGGTCTKSF